nr:MULTISPECIES: tetratricopeptide repeat protein [unclassified Burkholderia]
MPADPNRFADIQAQLQRGELIAAADAIGAWHAAAPACADAIACRAHWLRLLGRFDEAAIALEPALAATPPCVAAWLERARLARLAGQPERAQLAFDAAHRADPAATSGLPEWIALLHELRRHALARTVAQALCERAPADARSWFLLGLTHHYAGEYAAAADAYGRADALDPAHPMLRNNLAALRYQTGKHRDALAQAEAAIRADPDSQMAWCNCSNAWLALHEPARALIAAERACALGPGYSIAQLARANALKEWQRWPDALAAATQAHRGAPDDPVMQWSLAMLQLLHGDYANGWLNHEARWRGARELDDRPRPSAELQWQGEPLAGKTLMLWGEQGFGDALQFARFAPVVAERAARAGGRVVFACFAGLETLLARSFAGAPMRIAPHDARRLPAFDRHLPVGSAPLVLGVRPDTIPSAHGYLFADRARAARWAARLPADGRLRVGLVWSGSRTHQRNPLRALDPSACARMARRRRRRVPQPSGRRRARRRNDARGGARRNRSHGRVADLRRYGRLSGESGSRRDRLHVGCAPRGRARAADLAAARRESALGLVDRSRRQPVVSLDPAISANPVSRLDGGARPGARRSGRAGGRGRTAALVPRVAAKAQCIARDECVARPARAVSRSVGRRGRRSRHGRHGRRGRTVGQSDSRTVGQSGGRAVGRSGGRAVGRQAHRCSRSPRAACRDARGGARTRSDETAIRARSP